MSDAFARGLFEKFDASGRRWDEVTDEAREYWEASARDLAGVPRPAHSAIAKPGDTILVGYDYRLSDDEFEEMSTRLRAVGDDLGIRFGVIEGASSLVVVRSDLDVNGAPMRRRETLESDEVPGER